jgi:integrase
MKKRRQRGTGTLLEYRHADGTVSFRCQYRDSSGKQLKETIGRTSELAADGSPWTRRKAEDELRARINRVKREGYRRPRPVVFREYAWRWFNESQRPLDWKPSTIITYRCTVKRLNQHFGRMQIGKIERGQINSFLAQLLDSGLAARTVHISLTVLHSILDRAVEEKLIQVNPATGVRRPKAPRYPARRLTDDEAEAIQRNLTDPTFRLAALTFELLGIRMGELRNMKWRDVDLEAKRVRIEDSKSKKGERSLALSTVLVAELKQHWLRSNYKHPANYVFCHPEKGSKFGADAYRHAIHDARKKAGISYFRPAHEYRVTNLTEGALAGESAVILATRAGHSSIETTRAYFDLVGVTFPEEAETIAERRLANRRPAAEA